MSRMAGGSGRNRAHYWLLAFASAGCTSLVGLDQEYLRADAGNTTAGGSAAGVAGEGGTSGSGGMSGTGAVSGSGNTSGSGGAVGPGGSAGSGGALGSSGASGSGGSGGTAGANCGPNEKRCGDTCVLESPDNGCSQADCIACPPAPENAIVDCNAARQCEATCAPGFVPSGGRCVPNGTGGSGGSTDAGSGGTSGSGGTAGSAGTAGSGGTAGGAGSAGSGGTQGCVPASCPSCTLLGATACCRFSSQTCGCMWIRPYCI